MVDQQLRRFYFEPIEAALDAFMEELGDPMATRALRKLKFAVLGTAWTDFHIWDPDVGSIQAMAWAWEDLAIALSGYGESGLTGMVVALWSAVPRESWDALKEQLNRAMARAEAGTPNSVSRRYFHSYRKQGVRTPKDGFDLPCVVPTQGHRLKEWAAKSELDPDEIELQMVRLEEYERQGLIDLGDDLTVLRSISGGGGLSRERVSLEDKMIENPYALDKDGRPALRLVTWGEE